MSTHWNAPINNSEGAMLIANLSISNCQTKALYEIFKPHSSNDGARNNTSGFKGECRLMVYGHYTNDSLDF